MTSPNYSQERLNAIRENKVLFVTHFNSHAKSSLVAIRILLALISKSQNDRTKVTVFNTETGEISPYDSLTQAGEAHGPINKPLRKSFLIPGYEALMQATYDLIRNSEHASTPKPIHIKLTRLSDGVSFTSFSLGSAQATAFKDL
ncbi:hypothetical protein HK100_005286 [Physocladia obscura]|uniref:Uncharacterized protein n=1 Tax=Physocladia obscura TaxID=109957 RepID=A0AAD5STC0_9FUNG|nr:hypothetical protein HK100_005286 [Physocladia obscura]